MLNKTSTIAAIMIAGTSLANAQNCSLPWPYSVNVVDSHGQCVGTIVNVDPTIVAHQFGSTIYGIQVNAQSGIPKGLAVFFYPTPDCSGQAYMEDDANLPQFLWADTGGILWTNGTPPPGGSIAVQSVRQAPSGQCEAYRYAGAFLVGAATVVDHTLVNSLVPPFSVVDPHGRRIAER